MDTPNTAALALCTAAECTGSITLMTVQMCATEVKLNRNHTISCGSLGTVVDYAECE